MSLASILKRQGVSGFAGTVNASRYFTIGLALTVVKQALDYLLAWRVFGRDWTPFDYAFPGQVGGLFSLDRQEQVFYLSMLALSLPFLTVGLALTVRRLRDMGWPLWLVAFFFAPLPINLVFFLILSVVPGVRREQYGAVGDVDDVPELVKEKEKVKTPPGLASSWPRALAAILIPMPFAALVVYLGTHVFQEYGWSVFIVLPFVLPMISVVIYGYHAPRTRTQCLILGLAWVAVAALMMLVFAFEGAICILMLLPLILPIVMLGVMVGYFLVGGDRSGPARKLGRVVVVLLAALPTMVGAEHATAPAPPLFAVRTTLDVDAPPARVWRHVISFSDLPPPRDPLFLAGIAYPVRARIEGRGVGAVRRCEFSTGAFVEPIEVWDEPRLLRFGVTSNPPPMREWNPFFEIHPPHLDGFLVSRRGEFRLTALPDGRTRLEGTTWYHHGLWPAGSWRLWSDAILHRIHGRVLRHVKSLAEQDAGGLLNGESGFQKDRN
jgi:uncharacterized membrane protein YhaH (DUF805 family)